MMRFLLIAMGLLASSCSTTIKGPIRISSVQHVVINDASLVGTYISSNEGFHTSSYWIEGPEGLVIIDTQFLISEGKNVVQWAEKLTGKKVVLAIVLHPNPDKFNGVGAYKEMGIPTITSQQVRDLIPAVHKMRLAWFYDRFKPDYPKDYTLPDSFGNKTRELKVAGLTLKLHVLGAGCSNAHVVVEHEGHLFTGDLVTRGFHSWLELGLIKEWIARIQELKALEPEFVHPGRGLSGDYGLLETQEDYLKKVLEIVRIEVREGRLKKRSKAQSLEVIQDKIFAAYPGLGYPLFVKNGMDRIWEKYSR